MDAEQRKYLQIKLRDTARELFWSKHGKENYKCPVCNTSGVRFDVHHRDGDPFNNHLYNLIGLCHHCHKGIHRKEKKRDSINEWKDKFSKLGVSE